MECGINYPKIVDDTFYTKTYNQNRIMGLALLKSRLHLNGKMYFQRDHGGGDDAV